jgi:hypothetical protein
MLARRTARIAAGVSTVGRPVAARIEKLRRSVLGAAVGTIAEQGFSRRGASAGHEHHQRSRQ